MHAHATKPRPRALRDFAVGRWADQVTALLIGFCREVHDCRPSELPFDEQLIGLAGWLVFCADESSPCWSRLDVAALLGAIVDDGLPDEAVQNRAAVSLTAFYTFLVKHGHLTHRQARPVFRQLRPMWMRACARVLERLASAPRDRPRFAPAALLH